jgi:NHS family xanthosine MFS transporter
VEWIQNIVKENRILGNGLLQNPINVIEWHGVWVAFACYAVVVTILFAVVFRYKHDPKTLEISTR